LTDDAVFDYSLYLIQLQLQHNDKTMHSVSLENPNWNWNSILCTTPHTDMFSYNRAEQTVLLNASLPQLNTEQCSVFDSILQATIERTPTTYFLQGAAGVGKTFVYNTLCFAARAQEMDVLCVASSSIAALLLPGGRTAHFTLKIPIDLDQYSTCAISKRSSLANNLKKVCLLIWDECSMQHCHAFKAVDRSLQDI